MPLIVVCSGCHRDTITNQPHTQTSTGAWCERCWPREEIAALARELLNVMRRHARDVEFSYVISQQEYGAFPERTYPQYGEGQFFTALDQLDTRLIRIGKP